MPATHTGVINRTLSGRAHCRMRPSLYDALGLAEHQICELSTEASIALASAGAPRQQHARVPRPSRQCSASCPRSSRQLPMIMSTYKRSVRGGTEPGAV
ncbi:uncharacterized protein PHACADRAFT_177657 [Phanerochaete carnosa HHB-10118-sp]|uniref:Uncharacterized protein n=1 Tax=Phanerochaete carnosa (strain HHB-10118-sp) TaxID=650164 RepID=K5VWI8_PHACS|nr:uncharacterized protein PHACADRAFT_177657 [Phanerochaete carnosa HHB-10118-sp]EKM50954.1 hypothetical protein PHACADRAFT_177657 [Phanerochaete carnosa HHB-10118-sp]